MTVIDRRSFFAAGALAGASIATAREAAGEAAGEAAFTQADVTLPRDRVPLSFIIDDSTCLVNMGHFCMPQFATAWPDRSEYHKPWRKWPREIPDDFVRRFGTWCSEHGVRGKYSIVPYPACVGWLDRELPGWSRSDLQQSLKLVRELMLPNWDIHPEMITHTRVIDLKTGRPKEEISAATMENSYPQSPLSADELAEYLAYALRILKNCDLPCEGITTPGGFGNLVKAELSQAVGQAVRDVFAADVPHYFKYVIGGDGDTAPRLEAVSGEGTGDLRFTVNVPAGTGDWFGGWDGARAVEADRYADVEATSGRMVELIESRRPAVMLCHWPGLYCNGGEDGFAAFRRIVQSLHSRFADETQWMKVSEMARYWAAKELSTLTPSGDRLAIDSPVACPAFTLRVKRTAAAPLRHEAGETQRLEEVADRTKLKSGTWCRLGDETLICIDLPAGSSALVSG